MKLKILGTSSAFPTKNRNQTAALFTYSGDSFLFDCGEGTQRQIRIARENPQKITKIFISHWHGDHVLGLPGLLMSMAMNQRKNPLEIYGPKGTEEKIKVIMKAYEHETTNYKLIIHELSNIKLKTICETDKYRINALKLKHPIPCFGFSFEEKTRLRIDTSYLKSKGIPTQHIGLKRLQRGKDVIIEGKKISAKKATYARHGKKFAITIDTAYYAPIIELAKDADLFVCESTFSNKIKSSAEKGGHMTTKEAARLGKQAKVKHLVLTHFSQRYRSTKELEREARSVFKGKLTMAKDFMEIKI
jgi:ribonuclease Z